MLSRRHFLYTAAALPLLPAIANAQDRSRLTFWKEGDSGDKLNLQGRVVSTTGQPIPNARIALRQANGDTAYTEQYQGELFTATNGSFALRTVVPGQYASAKHIHIFVYAEGYQAIRTDILFKGDPNISFGNEGAYEVLLEEVNQGSDKIFVGGVEIRMTPAGGA